jgi:hypothetical protein
MIYVLQVYFVTHPQTSSWGKKIGDGATIHFWHDIKPGSSSWSEVFHRLYHVSEQHDFVGPRVSWPDRP